MKVNTTSLLMAFSIAFFLLFITLAIAIFIFKGGQGLYGLVEALKC